MKIPDQANKVFEGVIFDVYQWPQQMYDGTTEIFEALKRPDTTEVIVVQGDKIIISEQEQPMKPLFHSHFGGRSESDEEPLAAVKRELLEESGMVSDDWQLYKTYEFAGKIAWAEYLYIARNAEAVSEQRLDAGEKVTIKAVTFDEYIELITSGQIWTCSDFVIDIFRMKDAGTLDQFKELLWP